MGFIPIDFVVDAYIMAIENPDLFKSGSTATITVQKGVNVINVDGSSNVVVPPPPTSH